MRPFPPRGDARKEIRRVPGVTGEELSAPARLDKGLPACIRIVLVIDLDLEGSPFGEPRQDLRIAVIEQVLEHLVMPRVVAAVAVDERNAMLDRAIEH